MPRISEEAMSEKAESFYHCLMTRRTIRDFSPDPIPDSVLEHALLAAGTAPNGANLQPWHFVVVKDPAVKREIRLAAEEEERAFYGGRAPTEWLDTLAPLGTDAEKPFLETAPALIAIFATSKVQGEDGELKKTYYPKESVGIATGFLIAALHEAGLGTLTHTPSPMQFLNKILNRPSEEKPFLLLVVGYPSKDCTVPEIEKLPLEEIASWS
jgi:iodotyrosine deiodinase